GDEFISADLLARALTDAGVEAEFRRIDTRWPTEPFGALDGVREAAGDPGTLAELVRGADALVTHLAPLTAEVLDAGRGGLRVAELLRGFGSRVLAHDPYASAEDAEQVGVRLVDLPELLSASDVVSLHARLTPETKQMIDAAALAAMRPGAVLVNTARGEL